MFYFITKYFTNRPDIVKTGIKRGEYKEADDVMLHAIMSILCSYVENDKEWLELLPENDYDGSEECKEAGLAIKKIYQWWNFERAKEYKECDDFENNIDFIYDTNIDEHFCIKLKENLTEKDEQQYKDCNNYYYDWYQFLVNKDIEMAQEAVKLSKYMWT